MDGWERAFVLHGRPYSETSLMLDLFTEGHGRVRLLAKGARSRRSNLKGCLQPFTLLVRWGGRGEVKTLRNAEAVSLGLPLSGMMLYSGLYVNELLARVLEQKPTTRYCSSTICNACRRWRRKTARRSRRCVSSNWPCCTTWATASISCTAPAAACR